MRVKLIGYLLLAFFLFGCAARARQMEAFTTDMNSYIGIMTAEDFILKIGPPSYERKLADGRTMLVWTKTEVTTYTHQPPVNSGNYYGGFGGFVNGMASGMAHSTTRNIETTTRLTMIFDSHGFLQQWSYE